MHYGRYAYSHFFLRGGLGLVFVWIGIDMFRNPDSWIGFLPQTIPLGLTRAMALQLNGIFDTALGLLLILGTAPRLMAWLAVLHIGGVLVTQGIDAVLIRDVGLLGAATALALWPQRRHRRRGLSRFWHKSNRIEEV